MTQHLKEQLSLEKHKNNRYVKTLFQAQPKQHNLSKLLKLNFPLCS